MVKHFFYSINKVSSDSFVYSFDDIPINTTPKKN
jgi:hypothetical protein